MGRTKQVHPVRRHSSGDAPPLGWMTLPAQVSSSLLLAAEVQQEQQRRGVAAHPSARIDNFLEDPRYQYYRTDEKEGDWDGKKPRTAATNGTSRLASIVAEIEAREQAMNNKKRNQQRSKKHKAKTKKSVSFASEEAITIPSPEVELVQLDDDEAGNRTILTFSPRLGNSTDTDGDGVSKFWFVLKTISLPFGLIVVQSKDEPTTFPLRIMTRQGAMDLWTSAIMNTEQNCGKNERTKWAIGRAVVAGTLFLEIIINPQEQQYSRSQDYALRVCLTEKALRVCSPAVIPLQSRTHRSSRYQNLNDVLLILAATATPQLDVDPYQHHHANKTLSSVVTAKQVYALTDNVQLKNAWQLARVVPTEKLDVPGLVPKLRPYQEEVVRWMLQREQSSANDEQSFNNNNNKEWMLAWVVVDGRCHGGAHDDKPVSVPLSDWWEQKQNYQHPSSASSKKAVCFGSNRHDFLFYCPFAGWLVKSLGEARAATLSKHECQEHETLATGGILAESMGLGKSVEVLACILANSRKLPDIDGARSQPQTNARRRLDYSGDNGNESVGTADIANPTSAIGQQNDSAISSSNKIGYVEDLSAFGDADLDNESDDGEIVPATDMGAEDGGPSLRVDRGVPVTPEKLHISEDPATARWIDDDTLGACICGRLICFGTKSGPIVVCQNCEEPMHLRCAAFDDDDEMKRETTPVRFMQQFTNCKLDCRVCMTDRCPCCVGPRESCATLIVTPAAILNQWEREVQRHTRRDDGKPLRVVVYEGIKRLALSSTSQHGSTAMRALHPAHLASADIVLMTFDSLMTDLTHTDDNRFLQRGDSLVSEQSGGNLWKRKRYRVVPSPLMNIEWWRVCLDEAQRVETPTAGSAKMALKLKACHRWCVSGTPVGRGKLEDLYGLLLFLRVEPFCNKLWFRKCFSGAILPHQIEKRIQLLLSDIFWRSTKSFDLVREQMGVPEQVEKTIVLRFSSVEKHFYDRQLEKTLSAAGDLKDQEVAGKKRKLSSMNLISENLHKLRAACCHPQVGSSGIGSVKRSRTNTNKRGSGSDTSVSSRVMSMTQILQTLIDDAKTQCEEAQRLAVMHNNAMAAISKLKVEAKTLDVPINDSDHKLLLASCKLYEQSLTMADENAEPTLIFGEAALGGSVGFRSSQKIVQDCGFFLDWQWNETPFNDSSVWSKFDFAGQGRKVTQLRIRSLTEVPDDLRLETSSDFVWHLMYPKDCAFQCQSHGGEYVDVHRFSLPRPRDEATWSVENDFRTNKSKNWRIVVENFHPTDVGSILENLSSGVYAGLDIELFEAAIASDPLQRLHSLYNGALSVTSLVQLRESESSPHDDSDLTFSSEQLRQKAESMATEASKIESLYLGAARAKHSECKRRLTEAFTVRMNLEQSLLEVTRKTKPNDDCVDCWDDKWWDDFLVLCRLEASESQQQAICERLIADLDGHLQGGFGSGSSTNREGVVAFPVFGNLEGLRTALLMRVRSVRTGLGVKQSQKGLATTDLNTNFRVDRFKCEPGAHGKCMQVILDLSPDPGEGEIIENSRCHVCKADWFRKGPMCRHCSINGRLEDLNVDKITRRVLQSLHAILKGNIGASIIKSSPEAMLAERANMFFDLLNAQFREIRAAFVMWRIHLDLLNDLDELNSCKSAMRLTFDEDVTQLTEEELNAVVVPVDVCARYHEHAAKQAMASGTLSRAKGTLKYLKNQSTAEHRREQANIGGNDEETCSLCLDAFDSTRAVLRCGHSFHLTPCMETLRSKSGGAQTSICCPLRCRMRTSPDGVLIASEKRHDDGSRNTRRIKGSYGTKVTRLVCDILDVCETGAKSLVFSQWDDMLDICQAALLENGVQITRVKSVRGIAKCTNEFRASDCSVMLLNVKNGAEGLTLLEATNIFMVEPILNCGLDSQAINRVHRIGQTRKSTVWRYLVADTVEIKIDKLRREHQEDEVEDAINENKKSEFNAGGIDGGFQCADELLSLLQ